MEQPSAAQDEVGFVTAAKHYILTIRGLPSAHVNDLIVNDAGSRAIVRTLSEDHLTALALDPILPRSGDRYTYLPNKNLYSLGDHLFGRTINALGEAVDGAEAFPAGNTPLMLDVDAPGIEARISMREQLHTGVALVDTIVPIAKGQRQLVFGPVRGGKTSFLVDIIRNQRAYGTVCIYAIIGKTLSELEKITDLVLDADRKNKTIVIAALSDQISSRILLAPSVAFLVAEHFMTRGEHVLVILDDLDAHAKYLREVALLEGRLPGRESYPGDLFYEHAHLLERCGHFGKALGGGSITSLPVIESDPNTSAGIVSTNLMSCTDGHLSFLAELQAEGVYPAISQEQSVTRVGHSAQTAIQKQLSSRLRILLSAAVRQRQYTQFGSKVSDDVQRVLHQGDAIEAMLHQKPLQTIPFDVQIPLLALALTPFILERDIAFIDANKPKLIAALLKERALQPLRAQVSEAKELEDYMHQVESARSVFEGVCRA